MSAPCDLLTQEIFTAVAPTAAGIYTYDSLCAAITSWNGANTGNQIFTTGDDTARKNELAAFIGHTLHESAAYVAPREIAECGTTATDSGTIYCDEPPAGTYTDPYCSTGHSTSTTPRGCNCAPVSETNPFGHEANKLFFGRGPIQLSWNYNYDAASYALFGDDTLCTTPDMVATDSATAWGTAIWFWMTNQDYNNLSTTCHNYVTTHGSFGGSLNVINGGIECLATSTSTKQRLQYYCSTATKLGVGLLNFDNCAELQGVLNSCVTSGDGSCSACDGLTAQPTPPPTAPPTSPPTTPIPTNAPTPAPTSSPTTPPPTSSPTTAAPTKSPTPAPSRSPTPFLWYPDWIGSNQGCLADGNEPSYMTILASSYMYDNQESCCSAHYNWQNDVCLSYSANGNQGSVASSSTGLYYPDWSRSNDCKADAGDAPAYMRSNPTGWMTGSISDCCSKYYSWRLNDCVGTATATSGGTTGTTPTASAVDGLYYPNWLQAQNECLNDGNQPNYMTNNPAGYMHDTLQDCCDWNYSWDLGNCLGAGGVVQTGSAQYYVDWGASSGRCVQDCPTSDGGDCGGIAPSWEGEKYDSKSSCCSTRLYWIGTSDCLAA